MNRVVWMTDIHLNFVDGPHLDRLLEQIRRTEADSLVLTGDVAEATDVVEYLGLLDSALERPIYFILGNHDYYEGSIKEVRSRIDQLCRFRGRLAYLSHTDWIELTPQVALVGHDGWADGRVGSYEESTVMLNDFLLIEELAGLSSLDRRPVLERLGDEAAEHVARVLPTVLAEYPEVVLATHVPPMREACWHNGRISDDQWAPHFTCKAVGDVILGVMRQHPHRKLTVLCGHTHGRGETRPLENVTILTGAADYGSPGIERVFAFQ